MQRKNQHSRKRPIVYEQLSIIADVLLSKAIVARSFAMGPISKNFQYDAASRLLALAITSLSRWSSFSAAILCLNLACIFMIVIMWKIKLVNAVNSLARLLAYAKIESRISYGGHWTGLGVEK